MNEKDTEKISEIIKNAHQLEEIWMNSIYLLFYIYWIR